jgi:ribonuclease T1
MRHTMHTLSKGIIFLIILTVELMPWVSVQADNATAHSVLAYSTGQNRSNVAELPTISLSDLPSEAKQTVGLIKQGGPFPYPKDGITFGNREGRLPTHRKGYYREYTVKTPGSRDRGARRIVAGSEGEFYYTDDHYRTFKLIKE